MTLLRKGDPVIVIAGKHRAKKKDQDQQGKKKELTEDRGRVLEVFPAEDKVIVERVQRVVKHTKVRMTEKGQEGGIIEVEARIDASNVMYEDPKTNKPVRLGITVDENGNKRRITRGRNSSGTIID